MKYPLLFLSFFICVQSFCQDPCSKKSKVFRFDPNIHPWTFTEKLGNHPQFPFLQKEKGVITRALFLKAAKDPESRKKYPKEFAEFNELLHELGFKDGYKGLSLSHVENLYINPGTAGNLGFYNKEKPLNSYIYIRLNPAGEEPDGVSAWKITGPGGCYLYVLHTCGNAFYPSKPTADCCKEITVETHVSPLEIKNEVIDKPLHIRINFYQAKVVRSKNRNGNNPEGKEFDTLVNLLRSIDTVTSFKDTAGRGLKITAGPLFNKSMICKDTILHIYTALQADSTPVSRNPINYILSDTSYLKEKYGKSNSPCHKKWELSLDGGISFNTIPRFDNTTVHSRTNGGQIAGELAISRIFSHWFQAGISASYITLAYQDDVPYPGSVAGVYNTVYLGKPITPVQLFGKATIGGPLGWQSNISLSAGYSIPTKGKIDNNGNTLATKPSVKGGVTAGFKLGVAYFFNCKFGMGLSFNGQYFSNSGALQSYHLVALPITLGIRYRF
ncbi:hypothetical protein ACX0G9_24175 [Flavitalea flava]